jgi:lysophospholipase L1-like esterase
MRTVSIKATLALASVLLALVLSEVVLRAISPDGYYAWTPNRRMSFRLPPGRAPGIRSGTHFSANEDGIRGTAFSPEQRYRILAIGGSSTECLLLDDSLAWPQLLQTNLNRDLGGGAPIWVGNVGRSGLRAAHHVVQVKELLPRYPRIHAIVVLVGINDMQYRLAHQDDDPRVALAPDAESRLRQLAFDEVPPRYRSGPPIKRTELWRRLRGLKMLVQGWMGIAGHVQDESREDLAAWRRHRQAAAALRDTLPDLEPGLAEYARQLNALIDEATRFDTRVVLVTQPAIWRPGLPARLRDLLWLGGIGDFQAQPGSEYFAVEPLAAGLDRYNRTLLKVCRDRGVECIDLAAALPKDTTVFYDDVHLNEPGARRVADELAKYLLPTVEASAAAPGPSP